jgi:hypothetical protein
MPWTGKRRNFERRHCYAIRVIYSGITGKPDAIHMRDKSLFVQVVHFRSAGHSYPDGRATSPWREELA